MGVLVGLMFGCGLLSVWLWASTNYRGAPVVASSVTGPESQQSPNVSPGGGMYLWFSSKKTFPQRPQAHSALRGGRDCSPQLGGSVSASRGLWAGVGGMGV